MPARPAVDGVDTRLTEKPLRQSIDSALVSAIAKVDNLGRYLKSTWGLSKGDRIHELKF